MLKGSTRLAKEQQAILQLLPLHVGCVDINGRYIYWNAYSEKMFGYAEDEIVGHHGSEIIFPTKEVASHVRRTLEDRKIFSEEVSLRHRDGSVFPAQMFAITFEAHKKRGVEYIKQIQ